MPHIVLDNPLPNDGDATVDSDLPYASPNGYAKQVARYLKITRVVGRIPNVPGAKDPANIIAFLKIAAAATPGAVGAYNSYYGLSAQVWQASTQMSLNAAFGNSSNLGIAPPAGPPTNNTELSKVSHFINCHGAALSPEFYGQHGTSYPIALSSTQVTAHAPKNVVVAAECCFGAQLYDPTLAGTADPICIAYLKNGAFGFFGSSNIAYGPSSSNAQADLITQYFFESVVAGASLGRAVLQSRQRFIATQKMTNPTNLKTLAQFLLLGDPSICPCQPSEQTSATHGMVLEDEPADAAAQRKARRVSLAGIGASIADGKAVPTGPADIDTGVKDRIRAIARDRGYDEGQSKEVVLAVRGSADYRAAMKQQSVEERVMIVSEREKAPPHIIAIRHLIAHIIGEGIASIEECKSR
jgi:hypothetical protein